MFATQNGGGFLTEQFPDAYKVIWDFRGGVATSRHIPSVSFTGIVHPGLMGTAPSAELLAKWNAREQALIDTDPHRVPPLALPPLPGLGDPRQPQRRRLRPGRPRGRPHRPAAGERRQPGHQEPDQGDAGSSTRSSSTGAKLSMGDLHFSQGDGEITFCGAIEMGGFMDLHVDLIKGGMADLRRLRERDLHAGHGRIRSTASGWRSPGRR